MKKHILLVLILLLPSVSAFSQTLSATAVMRAGTKADDLNHVAGGEPELNKGTVGQTKDEAAFHFKSLIVFDVVSQIEKLAQKPKATLKLPIQWVKSADDVKDANIYYVGAFPKANFSRQDLWKIIPTRIGTQVGTIKAHQLAPIAPHNAETFEFDLEGKIASGDVSPVNRYLVFRVESLPFPAGPNGLFGIPSDPSQISLIIGGSSSAESSNTSGGY